MNETDSLVDIPGGSGGSIMSQDWRVSLGVAVFLAFLVFYTKAARSGPVFVDMDGVAIRELKGDTRLSRFLEPEKLSKEGKLLAGDEPFVIRNGRHKELLLSTPEHVREFYRRDGKDHTKPPGFHLGDYFVRLLGQCVGAQHGARWTATRSHFDPHFTHGIAASQVSTYAAETSAWLDGLAAGGDDGNGKSPKGAPRSRFACAPEAASRLLPFRLLAWSLYGEAFLGPRHAEWWSRLVELSGLHGRVMRDVLANRRAEGRWYNALPGTPERKRLLAFRRGWEGLNVEVVRVAREMGVPCPVATMWGAVERGEMRGDEFFQTLDEILFTNIDITSGIMSFMLTNLAAHKPFQDSLAAEIAAEKAKPDFRLQTYVGKQDSLLRYLVLECIRLRPAVWFSLPENTQVEKVIGRYRIPAGTPTVIDVRRLNRNAITWGADGDVFRPERFGELNPTEYRYGYMKFGITGKCLGKFMAEALLKVVAFAVLDRYELRLVERVDHEAKGGVAVAVEFKQRE